MGTKLDQKTLKILDRLYAVAQDESQDAWTDIYDEIATLVGSGPGGLTIFETAGKNVASQTTDFNVIATNMHTDALREYKEHFQFVSPFKERIAHLKAGQSFRRRIEWSDADYEKSELYSDLFRKHGIYEYEYHALYSDSSISGGINFSRSKSRPEFSKSERQTIDTLLPHIRRAFELRHKLIKHRQNNMCMVDILNKMDHGVLIVDAAAKVIFANSSAESVMGLKDGIEFKSDHTIRLARTSENQLLTRLLQLSMSEDIAAKGLAALDLQVSRPSGLRPLHLSVFQFNHEEFQEPNGGSAAIVFIHDPEKVIHTSEAVLMSTYGMTPAEAHLSALISDGLTVNEASEILNVQPNTVRVHLKNIYSKTQTNRQSELIRLILKGPASVIRDTALEKTFRFLPIWVMTIPIQLVQSI